MNNAFVSFLYKSIGTGTQYVEERFKKSVVWQKLVTSHLMVEKKVQHLINRTIASNRMEKDNRTLGGLAKNKYRECM
jgi:hypothetical protein